MNINEPPPASTKKRDRALLVFVTIGLSLLFFAAFSLKHVQGDHPLLFAAIGSACSFIILLLTYLAGQRRNEIGLRLVSERLARQNATLSHLSRHTAITAPELDAELRILTEQSANTLSVARVSIWLLSSDHRQLICQCLYTRADGHQPGGLALNASDYPCYFATLHEGRGFAADDAQRDERTREFTNGYLHPLGIGAMLDVPIRINNQLVGVVCHEHVGPVRHWTGDEQAFAASIGDIASLAYESVRRHEAEEALQNINLRLEDAVAARTEELRQANDRLQELDALKSRYLDTLSTRLQQTVADFEHVRQHDPLTGLPNRTHFHALLDTAIAQARPVQQRLAVLLLDLDAFRQINDTLGHAAGDAVLTRLAGIFRETLPGIGQAARIGSDEFALFLPGIADNEQAANIAQKLLFALATPTSLGEPSPVTASIGIALMPEDGNDRTSLLQAAETAMFSAKENGRNRYRFHSLEMSSRARELRALEHALRYALEHEQLSVHYQPQVRLDNGSLHGVEALARWQHPTRGNIPPATFIPVAEACGLIEALGNTILEISCKESVHWMQAAPPHVHLSVNVSARQLVEESFIPRLKDILTRTAFPPERLELEITESTLQVVETSTRLLNEVRTLGVRIAIDDFGTGYSSLSMLKALPIDQIKIDKSFIDDIPNDPNDIAIVEAIIAMSHTLGLSVVAEGVETSAQFDDLRRMCCAVGQGFLFSKPLPLVSLHAWMNERKAHGLLSP